MLNTSTVTSKKNTITSTVRHIFTRRVFANGTLCDHLSPQISHGRNLLRLGIFWGFRAEDYLFTLVSPEKFYFRLKSSQIFHQVGCILRDASASRRFEA